MHSASICLGTDLSIQAALRSRKCSTSLSSYNPFSSQVSLIAHDHRDGVAACCMRPKLWQPLVRKAVKRLGPCNVIHWNKRIWHSVQWWRPAVVTLVFSWHVPTLGCKGMVALTRPICFSHTAYQELLHARHENTLA